MPLELLERAKEKVRKLLSRKKPYDPEAKEEEIRQKRVQLLQEGVKRQAGYVLNYRKPEPKPESDKKQLEDSLRERAATIASAIIERASKKQRLRILAALQSLDPQKDESTQAVYDWLETIAPHYNIPVRNLQQAFFSQLQQEIQPNILKKDQKLLRRAVVPEEELSIEEALQIADRAIAKKQGRKSEAA